MISTSDVRVRRPHDHEALMTELQNEGGFATFRDVLLFAAAIGFRNDRSVPFTAASGDPIRYETLTGPAFSDAFINMIAVNVVDDPEIMDSSRLEDRIKIFENYANGGLEYLQEQVNIRHKPAAQIAIDLVIEALSDSGSAKPASVEELLSGATWH
ncbi:DNA phosphorothioation-associated protein 4 [Actinocorallia sp. B10E7]|uniref:DNA phosphorothioation-associated protein 4 n=1 Tax=Actinocorallia sp. B10E7 TaxID=3153558 RepID=UPI00325DC161